MISLDTNILFYALAPESRHHDAAKALLENLSDTPPRVAMCELVFAELYNLLRNPTVMNTPLTAKAATDIIQAYRHHPGWQLIENAPVMAEVWERVKEKQFARRRLYDLRLALTLRHHGVTVFCTTNPKDFANCGFDKVINPL